jgi:hypothetical protein
MGNKMRKIPFDSLVFGLTLFVAFLPLVFCDYLVTADGPCHFYNSHILVSWLLEGKKDFFLPFLQLNQFLDPNWITNAIQIPLLKLFPVIWAEKIFFALYLVVFSFGFRRVIKEVNPEAGFLASFGVLFAWNFILMKGFSNNAWSVAIWFWVIAIWMRALHTRSVYAYVMAAILLFALYLAHPLGLVFAFLSVGCVVFGYGLYYAREKGWRQTLLFYLAEAGKLVLCGAIPIYYFISFYLRREWTPDPNVVSIKDIANDLIHLRALNTLSYDEEPFILSIVSVILLLGFWAIVNRIRRPSWNVNDGLLLLFVASLLIIFNPPGNIAGGLDIGVRLGMFPFLCLLFWIGTVDFPVPVRHAASIMALGIAAGLMLIRLPIHIKASEYAAEIVTVVDSIKDQSTVLVLNYDWGGKTPQGEPIAGRMGLFGHVDCYLGTYKDLVISDNYEANFWYFPLVEHWETNMYMQTDKDGINFDHRPPRADMNSYKRRTGQFIDYVLMLSYTEEFADHPYTVEIFQQLAGEYKPQFTSANKRAILYKRIVY